MTTVLKSLNQLHMYFCSYLAEICLNTRGTSATWTVKLYWRGCNILFISTSISNAPCSGLVFAPLTWWWWWYLGISDTHPFSGSRIGPLRSSHIWPYFLRWHIFWRRGLLAFLGSAGRPLYDVPIGPPPPPVSQWKSMPPWICDMHIPGGTLGSVRGELKNLNKKKMPYSSRGKEWWRGRRIIGEGEGPL